MRKVPLLSVSHMGKLKQRGVTCPKGWVSNLGLSTMLTLLTDKMNIVFNFHDGISSPPLCIKIIYLQRWPPPLLKDFLSHKFKASRMVSTCFRHFCGWTAWRFTEAVCLFSSGSATGSNPRSFTDPPAQSELGASPATSSHRSHSERLAVVECSYQMAKPF